MRTLSRRGAVPHLLHWLGPLLGLAVVAALLPAAPVAAQAGPPSISIQPQSGPPGTVVTVFGRGAAPFATVRVLSTAFAELDCRAAAAGQLISEARADARGQFTAQVRATRLDPAQAGILYFAGAVAGGRQNPVSTPECFHFEAPPLYPQTGYRVEQDAFWDYFAARGGVETFGFPISQATTFMGCVTQFFQRHLLQRCGDGPVRPMNLLDPGLMPADSINFSVFPAHDPAVAVAAPAPGVPNYGAAALAHLQATVPDTFEGLSVDFFSTFVNTAPGDGSSPVATALRNLEVWGFPTSRPAFDPANRNFVYQRFQRGIMHYSHADRAARGVLLADWFKTVLTGEGLPPDLASEMQGSRFLRQYCPNAPRALCRPEQLPETDLTGAFTSR